MLLFFIEVFRFSKVWVGLFKGGEIVLYILIVLSRFLVLMKWCV